MLRGEVRLLLLPGSPSRKPTTAASGRPGCYRLYKPLVHYSLVVAISIAVIVLRGVRRALGRRHGAWGALRAPCWHQFVLALILAEKA